MAGGVGFEDSFFRQTHQDLFCPVGVIPVTLFASRAPGQWQDVEVTIKGNRVTAILNGVKVHDNVEVNRATGSELDANLTEPGPIMLQGDHGPVAFRNIRTKALK